MARGGLLLCLAALWLAPAARAQHVDEDLQLWAPVVLQATLKPVRLWVEVQPRFDDDVGRLGVVLYRPALAWLTPVEGLSLWGGYAFVEQYDPSYAHENRAWEQVQYDHTPGASIGLRLIHRLRAEQRFLQDRDPVAHRLRWMLRAQVPLALDGKLQAIISNEAFFNLNSVDGGPRAGFGEDRAFVGPGLQLVENARLEVGYMAQYVNRQGDEDLLNHVAYFALRIDVP